MATPPSVYTLYEPVVILEQSGVYAGRSDLGMQWDGPADAWYVPDAWRVSWPTAVYAQPADYPWRGYLRVASDFKAHEMRVALTDAGTMRVELVAWENNSGNVAGRLVCEVSPVPVGAG